MQDTGYRIQDTGYRIQDTGYRIQKTEKNISCNNKEDKKHDIYFFKFEIRWNSQNKKNFNKNGSLFDS